MLWCSDSPPGVPAPEEAESNGGSGLLLRALGAFFACLDDKADGKSADQGDMGGDTAGMAREIGTSVGGVQAAMVALEDFGRVL